MRAKAHAQRLSLPLVTADVLISDMERYANKKAGLQLLERIKDLPERPATIFYVGRLGRERGEPPGAFGITDRPDELIHLVLDVLERERVKRRYRWPNGPRNDR